MAAGQGSHFGPPFIFFRVAEMKSGAGLKLLDDPVQTLVVGPNPGGEGPGRGLQEGCGQGGRLLVSRSNATSDIFSTMLSALAMTSADRGRDRTATCRRKNRRGRTWPGSFLVANHHARPEFACG